MDSCVNTNNLEKHTVCIFTPEDGDSMFLEILVSIYESTQHHNPEDQQDFVLFGGQFSVNIFQGSYKWN
jgi:hypothetical protein